LQIKMNNPPAELDYYDPPVLGTLAPYSSADVSLEGLGFWEQDVATGKTECSDSIYRVVGVDPVVGRHERDFWVKRVHPDDVAGQVAAYNAFVNGETPTFEEIYRVRHEKGHWAWILARARWEDPDAEFNQKRLTGYVVDVTARHTEFDLLRKREERFRLSLSALRGLVYDRDLIAEKSILPLQHFDDARVGGDRSRHGIGCRCLSLVVGACRRFVSRLVVQVFSGDS